MLVSLAVRIGCGVNLQAFPYCSCLLGMVLRFPLGLLPLTPAHNALRCVLRSLVRTTATVGQKLKTGRITALGSGSYSYWFRNCGGTGGFCGGGSYFKELSGCSYWNLVYFG